MHYVVDQGFPNGGDMSKLGGRNKGAKGRGELILKFCAILKLRNLY